MLIGFELKLQPNDGVRRFYNQMQPLLKKSLQPFSIIIYY